ncbi:hypothetical protein L1987_06698 [Smallanthus sonchifolius]|uniref:Uncharacterized protein n=1 Tax=Smallanthus sonchifolius TaxID=185202 RepID=A0ACB9JZ22_9ASTR|nr:hypothetical protein L1987_06698 [Smallanthus sonchifolius]
MDATQNLSRQCTTSCHWLSSASPPNPSSSSSSPNHPYIVGLYLSHHMCRGIEDHDDDDGDDGDAGESGASRVNKQQVQDAAINDEAVQVRETHVDNVKVESQVSPMTAERDEPDNVNEIVNKDIEDEVIIEREQVRMETEVTTVEATTIDITKKRKEPEKDAPSRPTPSKGEGMEVSERQDKDQEVKEKENEEEEDEEVVVTGEKKEDDKPSDDDDTSSGGLGNVEENLNDSESDDDKPSDKDYTKYEYK